MLGVETFSTVVTLGALAQMMMQTVGDRQLIGVGSVGRETGKALTRHTGRGLGRFDPGESEIEVWVEKCWKVSGALCLLG